MDSFENLPPDERVSTCRRQLTQTETSLHEVELRLREEEDRLLHAQNEKVRLPSRLSDLDEQIPRLNEQVRLTEVELAAATETLATYRSTIQGRLADMQQRSTVQMQVELNQEYERIASALAARNELRARVGAMPAGQDEAIHTRKQRRRAEQIAAANYQAKIDRQQHEIGQAIHDQESKVDMLKRNVGKLRSLVTQAERELNDGKTRLTFLPTEIDLLKTRLARSEVELTDLRRQKTSQESALDAAIVALHQHNQILAEERRLERERQRALAYSTSKKEPVYQPRSRTTPSAGFSKYRDPTYRPQVGHHYVNSYIKSDGTFVPGHRRTDADDSFYNNWTSKGNVNPYTGSRGYSRF